MDAAGKGDNAGVNTALVAGADAHAEDVYGRTALMLSVMGHTIIRGHDEGYRGRQALERLNIAKTLLALGASHMRPAAAEREGTTVFHLAAEHGCPALVKLLASVVTPDLRDLQGHTVLQAIAFQDSYQIDLNRRRMMEHLLNAGADPFEMDREGRTVAEFMRSGDAGTAKRSKGAHEWPENWAEPLLAAWVQRQMEQSVPDTANPSKVKPRF